jgi:enhancing lycopene biosynthesis protein 2
MLEESARICRTKVLDLAELRAVDYEALIIPGGFGAKTSLSDYAFRGKEM